MLTKEHFALELNLRAAHIPVARRSGALQVRRRCNATKARWGGLNGNFDGLEKLMKSPYVYAIQARCDGAD